MATEYTDEATLQIASMRVFMYEGLLRPSVCMYVDVGLLCYFKCNAKYGCQSKTKRSYALMTRMRRSNVCRGHHPANGPASVWLPTLGRIRKEMDQWSLEYQGDCCESALSFRERFASSQARRMAVSSSTSTRSVSTVERSDAAAAASVCPGASVCMGAKYDHLVVSDDNVTIRLAYITLQWNLHQHLLCSVT